MNIHTNDTTLPDDPESTPQRKLSNDNENNTTFLIIKLVKHISLATKYIHKLKDSILTLFPTIHHLELKMTFTDLDLQPRLHIPVVHLFALQKIDDVLDANIASILQHLDVSQNQLANLQRYFSRDSQSLINQVMPSKKMFHEENKCINLTDKEIKQLSMGIRRLDSSYLTTWDFDVLSVGRKCPDSVLTTVFYSIFKDRGFDSKLKIPPHTFLRLVQDIEKRYHESNPYHNNFHAAEVLQALNTMLDIDFFKGFFTDLELFSALLAAAIHDIDHPGLNNQYLINTNSPLALIYNDISVLENHHLSTAFQLIKDHQFDIFRNFSCKDKLYSRKLIIEMVLGTDMKNHSQQLSDMDSLLGMTNGDFREKCTPADRIQILKYGLHCADISNTVRPFDVYLEWTRKLMDENFIQGDKEKMNLSAISSYCDRFDFDFEKWQVNFLQYIASPLWSRWSLLVSPESDNFEKIIRANLEQLISMLKNDKCGQNK